MDENVGVPPKVSPPMAPPKAPPASAVAPPQQGQQPPVSTVPPLKAASDRNVPNLSEVEKTLTGMDSGPAVAAPPKVATAKSAAPAAPTASKPAVGATSEISIEEVVKIAEKEGHLPQLAPEGAPVNIPPGLRDQTAEIKRLKAQLAREQAQSLESLTKTEELVRASQADAARAAEGRAEAQRQVQVLSEALEAANAAKQQGSTVEPKEQLPSAGDLDRKMAEQEQRIEVRLTNLGKSMRDGDGALHEKLDRFIEMAKRNLAAPKSPQPSPTPAPKQPDPAPTSGGAGGTTSQTQSPLPPPPPPPASGKGGTPGRQPPVTTDDDEDFPPRRRQAVAVQPPTTTERSMSVVAIVAIMAIAVAIVAMVLAYFFASSGGREDRAANQIAADRSSTVAAFEAVQRAVLARDTSDKEVMANAILHLVTNRAVDPPTVYVTVTNTSPRVEVIVTNPPVVVNLN